MNRAFRSTKSKLITLLTIVGLVFNSFAFSAASDCKCAEPTEPAAEEFSSNCCSQDSGESCCSAESQCCCSSPSSDDYSLCGCGESCGCSSTEHPLPMENDPVIPSTESQANAFGLATKTFVSSIIPIVGSEKDFDSLSRVLTYSSQQTCALLSRFTC